MNIDAPETHDPGCVSEAALGFRAADRLIDILNEENWRLERAAKEARDEDRYVRKLRLVVLGDPGAGEMLVRNSLVAGAGASSPGAEAAMAGHPTFYKLYERETADIVLRNRTLRWSTPGTFNDPFDGQFNLYFPAADEAMRDEVIEKQYQTLFENGPADGRSPLGRMLLGAKGKLQPRTREDFVQEFGPGVDGVLANTEKMQDEFLGMMRDFAAPTKILCLTDRFDNVLLWSHYAEQHKGVALRFDTPAGVDSPWRTAQPVHYVDELPLAMTRDQLSDFAAGRIAMDSEALARTMILTKASGWSYESEWRIQTGAGRHPDAPFEDVKFHPRELTGIILGAKMPTGSKAHFAELAKAINPDVEVLEARLASKAFKIEAG